MGFLGKFISALTMLWGLVVLALPITIIGANFEEQFRELKRDTEQAKRAIHLHKRRSMNKVVPEAVNGGDAHAFPAIDFSSPNTEDTLYDLFSALESVDTTFLNT